MLVLAAASSIPARAADSLFLPPERIEGAAIGARTVRIGDVTGDGRDDLVLGGGADIVLEPYGRLDVFPQTAAGTLDAPRTYSGHDVATAMLDGALIVADVTGDGRLDVITRIGGGFGVLAQQADGTLGAVLAYSGGSYSAFDAGDLNDDGTTDLLAAGETSGSDTLYVIPQTSAGTLGAAVPVALDCIGGAIAIGDINGDGRADIVGGVGTRICWILQNAGGGFGAPSERLISAMGTATLIETIAVGDLDGNGHADIIAGVSDETSLHTLYQSQPGTFDAPSAIFIGGFPNAIVIRDMTGEGIDDAVVLEDLSVVVHRGTSGPLQPLVAAPAVSISLAVYRDVLAVGDLNSDGRLDAATTHEILYGTAADLRVEVEHAPEPVLAGAEVVYTVTVTNAGPHATDEVELTYSGGGIEFLNTIDACPSPCSLGLLGVSESTTLMLRAEPSEPGTFTPTFSVTGYAYDTDSSNNVADETTTVLPSADVSILIAAGLPLAGSVTWFVEVENGGPLDAEAVNAEFVLPEGLALLGADSEQGSCSAHGRTVSCALGLLEQSLGTVIIQVDSRAAAPGSYTATASITSSTDDPDLTNNESDYTVDIAPGTPGLASEDSGGCGCRAVGASGTRNDATGYLSLITLVLFARETRKRRECEYRRLRSRRRASLRKVDGRFELP